MTRWRRMLHVQVAGVLLSSLLAAGPGLGATEGGDPDADGPASYWQDHFILHGFITLAYGELFPEVAGQTSGDHRILGLSEGGGFHGIGALNLRYSPAPRHTVILQVSAAEFGDSPVDSVNDPIELDWFFYEAQLPSETRIRVGRQPVSAGIYNEIRDVGVLLPFFRPAFTFYREGGLFSETVDGLGVAHRFLPGSPWAIDVDVYYGEFEVLQQAVAGVGGQPTEMEASEALGAQVWLNTPVEGLRFGLGGLTWDNAPKDASVGLEDAPWESWYGSMDAAFQRFSVRTEYRRVDAVIDPKGFAPEIGLGFDIYYWQLGWHPTKKLGLFLQHEFTYIRADSVLLPGGSLRLKDREDLGLSVVYKVKPNLVLKGEYHAVEAEVRTGFAGPPLPGGPPPVFRVASRESDYGLLSLSMSF